VNRVWAILLVLLGGSCYGLVSPSVKMAYEAGFSAGDVTSGQYLAATTMFIFLALMQFRHVKELRKKDLLLLAGLGILSTGTSVFYYVSLTYLPASLAIVLLFQFTWVVAVIDFLVTRRLPDLPKWLALVLVVGGTVLAVDLFHAEWEQVSLFGLLVGFLSSMTYGAFLFFYSYVREGTSPFVNGAVLSIASSVAVWFVFPPEFLWNGSLGEGLWIWALLIGFLGQVMPAICFNIGIPVIGGALAAVLGAIELPVAVVSSYLLLHERVAGVQWLGIGLILFGIVVSELKLRVRKEARL
jgi:drug/metabolite transporter (DMT)-like permease